MIPQNEGDMIINTIQDSLDKALQKNKRQIVKAYEQMQDLGGLPISIGIRLQGDSIQVKSVINFSFPMDKFKEVYKDTIELKQKSLDFDTDKGTVTKTGADKEKEITPTSLAKAKAAKAGKKRPAKKKTVKKK